MASLEQYAHELFDFFRHCDAAGLKLIFCQTVPPTGLGRALMATVARHGLARGALWLVWDVWVRNHTAEAFYAAIGARRYDDVFAMTLKGDALAALAGEPL